MDGRSAGARLQACAAAAGAGAGDCWISKCLLARDTDPARSAASSGAVLFCILWPSNTDKYCSRYMYTTLYCLAFLVFKIDGRDAVSVNCFTYSLSGYADVDELELLSR